MRLTSMQLPAILARSLAGVTELQNENSAVATLARAVRLAGARRIWTAGSIWHQLHGCVTETCYRATKTYDLSWSCSAESDRPDFLCQVKLGTKNQEDQEVLLYLGDLAFAGLDDTVNGLNTLTIAVVPRTRPTQYWNRLHPRTGVMRLILDPRTAQDEPARGAEWINPETGEVRPYTRSQYQKIFGAGTNAKFVGLFARRGRFTVKAESRRVESRDFIIYLHRVVSCTFEGPGSLTAWWP